MDRIAKYLEYIDEIYDKIAMKYLNTIDKQISSNLSAGHIETRPGASNGVWCFLLIPSIMAFYTFVYQVSPLYSLATYVSFGLLLYSALFLMFMSISVSVIKEYMFGGCLASSLASCLLIYTFSMLDLLTSLTVSVITIYSYCILLHISLTKVPKTFTVGEAMVVSQGIVLFGVAIVYNVIKHLSYGVKNEDDTFDVIINIAFLAVALTVIPIWSLTEERRDLGNFTAVIGISLTLALILIHLLLGSHVISVLFYSLFSSVRVKLIAFWLFLVGVAICILVVKTRDGGHATTVGRKPFHLLISIVFISGILLDPSLIRLAAGVALALLILVEILRQSNIDDISPALHSAFLIYADEKDCGGVAMTPLYLLCGVSCPLALTPGGRALETLGGVLALGVGDAAASWCGSNYGTRRIYNNKSIEGMVANMVSQIITVCILQFMGLLHVDFALFRTCISATITSVVEAKTDQVDNLILPLVSILGFQITCLLS